MRTLLHPILLTALAMAPLGCASAAESGSAPGPMRPLAPDVALDAAPAVDIDDEVAMRAWLAERVAAAKVGQRERVRLPVVRRADLSGGDCPSYAIAATHDTGPVYWLDLRDLTSAGIPHGEWQGWVDGRFTGETRTYRDVGGTDITTPVLEVMRQSRRGPDDLPAARSVRDER